MDEHSKNFVSCLWNSNSEMGEPRIYVRVYLGVTERT